MMFEETHIRNLLKCSQCEVKFDDYEQPKSLPCGKMICSLCVDKIEKEAVKSKFKCVCFKVHQIPEDGFAINELALHLLTSKPKEIWRGKSYENLKINLQKIEALIQDLNFDLFNGSDKIKEYCNEQRRLVQLSTENKMQELNKINEGLMSKIDEFEMKCKQCYSAVDDSFKEKINRLIKEAKYFLNEKQEYLKQIQINDDELKTFIELGEYCQLDLNREHKALKRKMFGKKLKFNMNLSVIDSETIGLIEYEKLEEPSCVFSGSSDKTIKLLQLESGKCIKTFAGHIDSVTCIKNVLDNILISGDINGSLKIWKIETGECLKTIKAHTKNVQKIKLISNDKLATCSNDKTIKLFNLNTYELIRTFIGHEDIIMDMDIKSNGQIVSCSTDKTIRIWNVNSGECLKIFRHKSEVTSVKVCLNGKIISGTLRQINVWNIESGTCTQTFNVGHTSFIRVIIQISNDKIASGCQDGKIIIWNIENGECFKTINVNTGIIWNLTKLSNNKIISCSNEKTMKVWDIETGACLNTLDGHIGAVLCIDLFD